MAGEVAVKKMNFLPAMIFQALPIPVSGEAIKNAQPPAGAADADPGLPALSGTPSLSRPSLDPRGQGPVPLLATGPACGHHRAVGGRC